MSVVRWFFLLPGAVLYSIVVYYITFIPVGLYFGWNELAEFLEAPDMKGMYFHGTYLLVMLRGVSSFAFIQGAATIAPSNKLMSAKVSAFALAAGFLGLIVYINLMLEKVSAQMTFSAGYRLVVELVAIGLGGLLAVNIVGDEIAKKDNNKIEQISRH